MSGASSSGMEREAYSEGTPSPLDDPAAALFGAIHSLLDGLERASEAKDSRIRDLLVEIKILKAENAAGRQQFAEVSTERKELDEENTAARSEIARLGH